MATTAPGAKPANPCFSSGPCAKRPGWSPEALSDAALGRSHRSKIGKTRLQLSHRPDARGARLPDTHRIGIVARLRHRRVSKWRCGRCSARAASTTLAWESFGEGWVTDAVKQLKLRIRTLDTRRLRPAARSGPGRLVERRAVHLERHHLGRARAERRLDRRRPRRAHDLRRDFGCFRLRPRLGRRLDVVTFSWQKVLGGEGGAWRDRSSSPRAVERLETYTPPWPLPKVFRLTKGGKVTEGFFKGETINTPSMLASRTIWMRFIGRSRSAA